MSSNPLPRAQTGGLFRRTFRKSKWLYVIRPALTPAMLLFFFGVADFLGLWIGLPPLVLIALFLPALLAFLSIAERIRDWGTWGLVARQGTRKLLLFEGLMRIKETEIPLTDFVTISVEQDWWDRRLDIGTVIINAMGGPFIFSDIEDFEDFREVLRTCCAFVPQRRLGFNSSIGRNLRAILAPLGSLSWRTAQGASTGTLITLRSVAMVVLKISESTGRGLRLAYLSLIRYPRRHLSRSRLHQTKRSGSSSAYSFASTTEWVTIPKFRGDPFNCAEVTAAGCWAFADEFLLRRRDWSPNHCYVSDPSREYYQDGVPRRLCFAYLNTLRSAGVLIVGAGGRERVSARIHSIDDVIRCTQPLFEN